MGMRIYSDVAVDDFSLSPECFGLNIPEDHLGGYNYWDVRQNLKSPTYKDFEYTNCKFILFIIILLIRHVVLNYLVFFSSTRS